MPIVLVLLALGAFALTRKTSPAPAAASPAGISLPAGGFTAAQLGAMRALVAPPAAAVIAPPPPGAPSLEAVGYATMHGSAPPSPGLVPPPPPGMPAWLLATLPRK